MSLISNGAGTVNPGNSRTILTGASLAHRDLDKRQLAVLAADVLDGRVWFVPSQHQLEMLFGVSVPYIQVARGLSPQKRAAILNGDSTPFRLLRLSRQLPLPGIKTVNGNGYVVDVDDQALAALAHIVGSERMLAAAISAEQVQSH